VGVRERADGVVSPGSSAAELPALELRGVVKRFGDLVALDGVDFTVARGTVHALVGENGAGKSTLMRIADGMISADAGTLRLFGTPLRGHDTRAAARAGIGMVHQHLSLVPGFTVTENLVLGGRGLLRPAGAQSLLDESVRSAGLPVPTHALARDLSIVEQQRLEILKSLARGAMILILDEPTAVLAPSDVAELLRWIRVFAAGGGSVVLVTHKLREALAVADDVTVLRRGRVVLSTRASDTTESDLARAMFPEQPPSRAASDALPDGEVVVRADSISVADTRRVTRVREASFRIRRGEILGIAAIDRSGHRELLSALAGFLPVTSGALATPGRVAFIPADRLRDALVAEFSLVENIALRGAGRRRGVMPWSDLAQRTSALIERFAIRAASPSVEARTLSGGNQQRLVVARELEEAVDLVVADNPTRGLDLRATTFVHNQLRAAAERGAAVVFHSSDLDEVLAVAARVVVVFEGRVIDAGPDRDAIGRAMVGTATANARPAR
jgi:general nucleoside transport system ATP-binding protein